MGIVVRGVQSPSLSHILFPKETEDVTKLKTHAYLNVTSNCTY